MGPITTWAGASTVALVVMTGLYLDKRDDFAAQVEQCNADKLEAVAEAERITREAQEAAIQTRLTELARQVNAADEARRVAEAARREAESRPPEVREVIRRVSDANACLDTGMPDAVIDSLRLD